MARSFLASGTVLQGRFYIDYLVKEGGMGAVYSSLDRDSNNTKCAVKEMLDFHTDPTELARAIEDFDREADMLAGLNHQSIPRIFARFTENDRHYLVMEFIEGVDLEKHLQMLGGSCPEDDVVYWAAQILEVLAYLHSQSPPIVYRDVKPSNLMLCATGQIKLVDFGIARLFNPIARGTMIGTPGYAPPEQYQGLAEPRSDIYSLGATMHHLLTGRDPRTAPPFNFPPTASLKPTVSARLDLIIGKALSFHVEDRYALASEMLGDLKVYTTSPLATIPLAVGTSVETPQIAPVLALDQKSLDFGTVAQDTAGVTKRFVISNPMGPTRGVTLKGYVDTNQPWIKVSPSRFTIIEDIATVIVSVDPSSLPNGKHSGAVSVTSNGGIETMAVLVDVLAPVLEVNPRALDLGDVSLGQIREGTLFILNKNRNAGLLSGTIKAKQAWITVAPTQFAVHDRQEVDFRIRTADLTGGSVAGDITIDSNGGTYVIPVSVNVRAAQLSTEQEHISWGELMRKQKRIETFKIFNKGEGILEGTIRGDQPWLSFSSHDFKVRAGGSTTIQVMVDATDLERERAYQGQILINSNGGTGAISTDFFVVPKTFWEFWKVWRANSKVHFRSK